MITLINQANYLIDKPIKSIKEKHQREGGRTDIMIERNFGSRGGKGDCGYAVFEKPRPGAF